MWAPGSAVTVRNGPMVWMGVEEWGRAVWGGYGAWGQGRGGFLLKLHGTWDIAPFCPHPHHTHPPSLPKSNFAQILEKKKRQSLCLLH